MSVRCFKKGDKVFDIRFGWGEVVLDDYNTLYPIAVVFTTKEGNEIIKDTQISYLSDGRCLTSAKTPILSFSEYTLEGFNNKKPLPKLNVDDIVYVRNREIDEWLMRRFSHFDKNGTIFCFNQQRTSKEEKETTKWEYFSVENPLLETNL